MSSFTVKRDCGLFIGDVDVAPASGTIQITENGEHDVARYATADVNVPQPSGKINITQNGTDIDVSQYATADVNVPQPSGKIKITQNGTDIDVSSYATADVNVEDNIIKTVMLDTYSGYIDDSFTINYGTSGLLNYYIKNNVQRIRPYCFTETGLKMIDLSSLNRLIQIHNHAFYRCRALSNIILPQYPVYRYRIDDYAFANCYVINSIDLRCASHIGEYILANTQCVNVYISKDLSYSECDSNAFTNATINNIYYTGTQTEWNDFVTNGSISIPASATVHYDYVPS